MQPTTTSPVTSSELSGRTDLVTDTVLSLPGRRDHRLQFLDAEFAAARPELGRYCYRMLGSAADADDAVQDAYIRARRGYQRFEGRSSVRSWLFSITTNVCLDMLRQRRRRALPLDVSAASEPGAPGAPLPGETWVTPFPTPGSGSLDPADQLVERETMRLASIAALQRLPARQRAVLILRDVLRWSAAEVAELLDTSPTAVHSALRRARRAVDRPVRGAPAGGTVGAHPVAAAPVRADPLIGTAQRYLDAFSRYDVDALVALLTEDVVLSMPPYPGWLRGADDVRRFLVEMVAQCAGASAATSWLNGTPAVLLYRPDVDGVPRGYAIHVLDVAAGGIEAIHAFLDPGLFAALGLPATPPPAGRR